MDGDTKKRLLFRQLQDIQVQADRILKGDHSGAAIESFARYTAELNRYIKQYMEEEEIVSCLKEIP